MHVALRDWIARRCLNNSLAAESQGKQEPAVDSGNFLRRHIDTGIFGLVQAKLGEFRQADSWAEYHSQYQSNSQTDIKAISGSVEIFPGRKVELDLFLDISTSSSESGDVWLVLAQPGYRIKTLELNGSPASDFEFENGLIKLPRGTSILV